MSKAKDVLEQLVMDITNDEEADRAIQDAISDLRDVLRKSKSDKKRMLKDIKSTVDDLIKYYR